MWNYRIFRRTYRRRFFNSHMAKVDHDFVLKECYYSKKGKPNDWSKDPDYVCGDNIDDLIGQLRMMLGDAVKSKKDVLDDKTGKSIQKRTTRKRGKKL